MNSPSPTVHFHDVLRSLTGLPERQQLSTLKIELFHALKRADEARGREQALEQELIRLRAEGVARGQEHNAFAAWLDTEFANAKRALDRVHGDRETRLRALRAELAQAETQCDTLEALCRSLVLTLEQAAADEAEVHDVHDTSPGDASRAARSA